MHFIRFWPSRPNSGLGRPTSHDGLLLGDVGKHSTPPATLHLSNSSSSRREIPTCAAGRNPKNQAHAKALALLALSVLSFSAPQSRSQNTAPSSARQKIEIFEQQQSLVKTPTLVSLSPDGSQLTWTVSSSIPGSEARRSQVYVAPTASPQEAKAVPAPNSGQACNTEESVWSPDNHTLAFLSDCATPNQLQVFTVDTTNFTATPPTNSPERICLSSPLVSGWAKHSTPLCSQRQPGAHARWLRRTRQWA